MRNFRPHLFAALIISLPQFAGAQSDTMTHTEGMVHDPSMTMDTHGDMDGQMAATLPNEPGQGAFAALAEIVSILVDNPDTDWDAVNISGLRDHLVDMDMLITHTDVTATEIPGGLQMVVSTTGRGGAAASRMVPAHGPVMNAETGWNSDVQENGDSLIWQVTSDSDATKIRALGFYGLMATGDHHRQHHMAMASGQPMH